MLNTLTTIIIFLNQCALYSLVSGMNKHKGGCSYPPTNRLTTAAASTTTTTTHLPLCKKAQITL